MTEKGLADSKASFESTEPNCTQLAQEHEATVAGRAEELKVIVEAKEVLMGTTSETNVKKADKGAEIDKKMSPEIDQMSARSAQLKGEDSALQSALTELTLTQTKAEVNAKRERCCYV